MTITHPDPSSSQAPAGTRAPMLWFIVVVLIPTCLAVAFYYSFISSLNARLDELESRQSAATRADADERGGGADADTLYIRLDPRVSALERQQTTIIQTSRGALEQMNFVFSIVAAFFGLFAVFFAYRQILGDQGREKHDEQIRNNISVINNLIETLSRSYDYRSEVDNRLNELRGEVSKAVEFRTKTEQARRAHQREVNEACCDLFQQLNRENFKSDAMQRQLEHLYIKINSLVQSGAAPDAFSGFCSFVTALFFFNRGQYELAAADLERALRVAALETESERPRDDWYGEGVLRNDLSRSLMKLQADAAYHLGIVNYNIGAYANAIRHFRQAAKLDPTDFRSRGYVPELMYFDATEPFLSVIGEFDNVLADMEATEPDHAKGQQWCEAMAGTLMRKGNCYLPKRLPLPPRLMVKRREEYQKAEDPLLAVKTYQSACEHAKAIPQREDSLPSVFVRFSLAQALSTARERETYNLKASDLFREVFDALRRIMARKTEPIVLVQLNYAAAICAFEGKIKGANGNEFLGIARDYLPRVPREVLVFSPTVKINLKVDEIERELDSTSQLYTHGT